MKLRESSIRWAVLVVAAALLAGLWRLAHEVEVSPSAADVGRGDAAASAMERGFVPLAAPTGAESLRVTAGADPTLADTAVNTVQYDGWIRLVDDTQAWIVPALDGYAYLRVREGQTAESRVEPRVVEGGRFGVIAPLGSEIAVERAELFGVDALPVSPGSLMRPGEMVTLDFRWKPGCVLDVVDADVPDSAIGYVHVCIAEPWGMQPRTRVFPTAVDLQVGMRCDGPSPLQLPASSRPRQVWVGAPGYAWTSIHVEGDVGTRTVRLARGSAVRLTASVPRAAQAARCRLGWQSGGSAETVARGAGQIELSLDGIPPGIAQCTVRALDRASNVVGEWNGELALTAGETLVRSIEVSEHSSGSMVIHLAAELVPPSIRNPTVSIASRANSQDVGAQVALHRLGFVPESTGRSWTRRISALSPGQYTVSIDDAGLIETVTVVGGAELPVVFDATRPRGALIHVVEAETLAPLPTAEVTWRLEGPGGTGVMIGRAVAREAGVWELPNAGDGAINVCVRAPGFLTADEPIVPGEAERVVELAKVDSIPINLTVREQGSLRPLSLSDWREVRVTPVDSAGVVLERRFSGASLDGHASRCTVLVSAVGKYQVADGRATGMPRFEPCTIDVATVEGAAAELAWR